MAGIQSRRGYNPLFDKTPVKGGNNGLVNQYNLFGSAVNKQQGDYDSIMEAYRRMLAGRQNNTTGNIEDYKPETFTPKAYSSPSTFSPVLNTAPSKYTYQPPVAPTAFKPVTTSAGDNYRPNQYGRPEDYSALTTQYKQSGDLTDAIGKLKNLSETGGYTPEGIADLRERGISPIRSIYASANRDVTRAKALQGGSSNAYNALKSKMARELSDKIGGAVTNVNAGIAQNVAQNKLQASPIYASVTGGQSDLQNSMGRENTSILNNANFRNVDNRNRINEANVDLTNQGNLFNMNRNDQFNRENADTINRGNLYNIGRTDDYNKQLFDEAKFADLFNIGRIDENNRSNTDLTNQTNLRNIGEVNTTNRANTDLFNNAGRMNTETNNEGRRINLELPMRRSALSGQRNNEELQILDSMKSLFGTIPALANLFGSQAMQGAGLQNTINQGNTNNAMEMIMRLMQQLGGR